MEFKISGHIREKESNLGVKGLIVKAYDKDMLYDDLLGTALTDQKGYFEMNYTHKEFRELFEMKPDIYLVVYAPVLRHLTDTKDAIRWGSSKFEEFEIFIDRETLGSMSPTRPDDEVEGGITLPARALKFTKSEYFQIPKLPGFKLGGNPGAPAIPEQTQYVALPLGGDILSLEVIPGDPVRFEVENPFPVQRPFPDIGTDPEQFGDGFSMENVPYNFTAPDPAYFDRKTRYPKELVSMVKVEETGLVQMAAIRIRPVQWDPIEKAYFFYPNLRYTVKFDLEKAKRREVKEEKNQKGAGIFHAEMMDKLLQLERVIPAKDIRWPGFFILEEFPYLVITDNYQWPEFIELSDGSTRPPNLSERGSALTGDVVEEFEKLAKWKTAKGMRARVVTVSDIVDKKFGDFTNGGFARDLQEVIRNFIKYARKTWGTLYILLAGDVNVVPMRKLAGSGTYPTFGCSKDTVNPPLEDRCAFITGKGVMKIRPRFTPEPTEFLSTLKGGIRIPFNRQAGSGYMGWYYTTETEFTTKNEGFTIDDNYYWMRTSNSIPSDLYYTSLVGPGYSVPGKHDFDDNNNGIYGQFYYDHDLSDYKSLDQVDFWSDLWVGRASVETQSEAEAFVEKVLTYEQLEKQDVDGSVDISYLNKILYAADYYARVWHYKQGDTSIPPVEKRFTHAIGTNATKLHTPFNITMSGGIPSYRIVMRSGTTNIVIPYNTAASATNLGWYFATDNNYNAQSATPTKFIIIKGPEADIDGDYYLMDPMGLELAFQEKENLRGLNDFDYPDFTSVERHYTDYYDLAPPPPLIPLEQATVNAAINNGVHFLSLTGHGSPGGCCKVYTSESMTNHNKFYIAYSLSCSTARPDGYDSLAEVMTNDPDGGAIGYVGYTRYGWVGTGDNYEEFFWHKLGITGRMGPAAGLRLATGGVNQIWTLYTQTLFGDPEMPVYTRTPQLQEVSHPATVELGDTIQVTVRKLGVPVSGHRVTLLGGWSHSGVRPKVFMTKTTNSSGMASFSLPSGVGGRLDELMITVTRQNFKPYINTIEISELALEPMVIEGVEI